MLPVANTEPAQANDTLFLVSDVFDPSLAGTAGVGIIGSYVADGFGNISFASVQAQMNDLSAPIGAFGGPANDFSLTISATGWFLGSWLTVRVVGATNFTVAPGDSVVLPGSLLLEDNDNAAIQSEAPEPGTVSLLSAALLAIPLRKFRKA